MTSVLYSWLPLLAQEGNVPADDGGGGGGGFADMMPAIVIIFVLFYFLLVRPQKKKEETFRQMIDNLKKNDRVVTVGGIYGVVTGVHRDADRITLRVDDVTGATIRVGASAIAKVVVDSDEKKKTENETAAESK